MTAYSVALGLHSWVRWAVLVLGVVVAVRATRGWLRGRAWSPDDERLQRAFVGATDTQLLFGLLLFVVLSPLSRAFRADMAHAVHDHVLRFFGLEHAVTMLLAVTLIHVGRVRSRRVTGATRQRHVALWTGGALALVFAGMPWPGLRHGRPLARGFTLGAAPPAAAGATPCPPAYAAKCAACHGANGRGDGLAAAALTPKPRNFADTGWLAARTDAELSSVIREGGARHGLSPAMPPHDELSASELDALVACVRSFSAGPAR